MTELPKRNFENWLDAYLEYTEKTEGPEIFKLWAGISAVSVALGRHVWYMKEVAEENKERKRQTKRRAYPTYVNQYIFLIAESARCKKGLPISQISGFLKLVDTASEIKFLPQKVTPSAIYSRCSGGNAEKDTEVFICSSELSTSFSRDVIQMGIIPLLTDLYDSQYYTGNKYVSSGTRQYGDEKIYNPCFNIFGGSNLEWFKDIVPQSIVGGGFFSRVIMVYTSDTGGMVPHPEIGDEDMERGLVNDLDTMRSLRGSFRWDTWESYDWWDGFYTEMKKRPRSRTMDAFYERRSEHLLKLAMVLAAAQGNLLSEEDLILTRKIVEKADKMLNEIEAGLPTIVKILETTPRGQTLIDVQEYIRRAGEISHRDLLSRLSGKMDAESVRAAVKTIEEMGNIKTVHRGPRSGTYYAWLGK